MAEAARHEAGEQEQSNPRDTYKWIALSVTTVGVVLATIDSSIMLIAMPDIFRGIKLDPLIPSNSFYLLWMILSFLVVSSVLVVSLGRLGDLFGRVRMYNLGFVIYTVSSLVLTIDWLTGQAGATYLIVGRVFQGVGAAFLVANSAAILTDAFPSTQRGLALRINNVAGISGMFIGLVLGGLLSARAASRRPHPTRYLHPLILERSTMVVTSPPQAPTPTSRTHPADAHHDPPSNSPGPTVTH